MFCKICGKEIEKESIYCPFCGLEIKKSDKPAENKQANIPFVSEHNYSDLNTNQREIHSNSSSTRKNIRCQICSQIRPTKEIHFMKNVGMLFSREYSEIEGHLCKQCINRYFWEYFLTNIFLGWWGTISFIINPFLVLNNLWYYLTSLFMKKDF